jgi:hypothetical protein
MLSGVTLNLRAGTLCAALACAVIFAPAPAARAAGSDAGVPATSIVPSGPAAGVPAAPESAPPPEAGSAASPVAAPKAKPKPKAPVHHTVKFNEGEVEPASARLKLVKDDWALSEPSKWSKHVERVHAGKYVVVTGSTRYYLQVKLKSGTTAYVSQAAVDLVKPTDKIFQLTRNAAVLDKPNRWGKKVAQVHTPHSVHVVGVALSYVKIRMKNGLEGYVPMTALQ